MNSSLPMLFWTFWASICTSLDPEPQPHKLRLSPLPAWPRPLWCLPCLHRTATCGHKPHSNYSTYSSSGSWQFTPWLVAHLVLLAHFCHLVGVAQAGNSPLVLQECNTPGVWPYSQELLAISQMVAWVPASGNRTGSACHCHRLHLNGWLWVAHIGHWIVWLGLLWVCSLLQGPFQYKINKLPGPLSGAQLMGSQNLLPGHLLLYREIPADAFNHFWGLQK